MGSHYQTIVDLDATPEEAEALGARVAAWLVEEGSRSRERSSPTTTGRC